MAVNALTYEMGRQFFKAVQHGMAVDRRVLVTSGLVLEREIKLMLSHPGTGRVYGGARSRKTGRKRKQHQASAPGEPPAVDTGVLRNTIGHEVIESMGHVKLRVGSNQKYAQPLEFGTMSIKPRPFMRPAFELARKQMSASAVSELRKRGG